MKFLQLFLLSVTYIYRRYRVVTLPPTQRPWHEYEHNFQIMYKVGMGHKPQIPEKLSTEGKDFLGHCLESEPKRRWTASTLLDHPFVKVRDAAGFHSACVFFFLLPAILRY